ncbi:MAG: hypothetical protein QW644_04155 [Candidatus Micrarchaeaceae archaeon]
MAIFGHKQQPYHADFRDNIRVESGDPQAKEALDHVAAVLLAYHDIMNSLKPRASAAQEAENYSKSVMESIRRAADNFKRLAQPIRSIEDLKYLALKEAKAALELFGRAKEARSDFARDEKMMQTVVDEINKTIGKTENHYEDALRIFMLLYEESKDLGRMAEDKHYFGSGARQTSANVLQH